MDARYKQFLILRSCYRSSPTPLPQLEIKLSWVHCYSQIVKNKTKPQKTVDLRLSRYFLNTDIFISPENWVANECREGPSERVRQGVVKTFLRYKRSNGKEWKNRVSRCGSSRKNEKKKMWSQALVSWNRIKPLLV